MNQESAVTEAAEERGLNMNQESAVTEAAEEDSTDKPRKKARRGFAAMSPEKQAAIASLGGKAAHARGTAHEFSPEEGREAGRKGGQAAQRAKLLAKRTK